MALGSTQLLTEMSTRNISWGKGGRCVRLTTLPPSCAVVMKSGNLNFLEPSGPLRACNGTALPLPFISDVTSRPFRILPSCQLDFQLEITLKNNLLWCTFGAFLMHGTLCALGPAGALSTPLYVLTLAKGCRRFFRNAVAT